MRDINTAEDIQRNQGVLQNLVSRLREAIEPDPDHPNLSADGTRAWVSPRSSLGVMSKKDFPGRARPSQENPYDRRAKNWCTISVCRGKASSAGAVMITRASASRLDTNGANSMLCRWGPNPNTSR